MAPVVADAVVSRAGIGAHDNVVDIGCGIGELLLWAGRMTDGMVIGFDITTTVGAVSNNRIDHADLPKKV